MNTCHTANCGRAVRYEGQRYCDSCVGVVLRTGQEPVIAPRYGWVARAQAGALPARAIGGRAA